MNDFATTRQEFQWGVRGKDRKGEVQKMYIYQLSDSHLLHIIGHIFQFADSYVGETLATMLSEAKYRSEHDIFVPDYNDEHYQKAIETTS